MALKINHSNMADVHRCPEVGIKQGQLDRPTEPSQEHIRFEAVRWDLRAEILSGSHSTGPECHLLAIGGIEQPFLAKQEGRLTLAVGRSQCGKEPVSPVRLDRDFLSEIARQAGAQRQKGISPVALYDKVGRKPLLGFAGENDARVGPEPLAEECSNEVVVA
jgi:hypothetical protein